MEVLRPAARRGGRDGAARRDPRREDRDRAAARRAAPARRQLSAPSRARDDGPSTMLPLEVEEFLSWMASERGRSANTLAAYRRDLTAYCAWLRDGTTCARCRPRRSSTGSSRAAGAGAAPSSVARQLAAIRMLHRFLAEEGVRPDDPTADVEGVRVPAGIPHPLSEDEVDGLLAARGGDRSGRAARPGAAGVPVRDRRAHQRGVRAVARRRRPRGAAGPPVRQGSEGAHRAVRSTCRGGAGRVVGRSGRPHLEPPRWARRGDQRPCS